MKKVYFIAIFAALFAGLATFAFAQNLIATKEVSIRDDNEVAVYVAKVDVPMGTKIETDTLNQYFQKVNVAQTYVVNGAVTDMNTVMGKLSTRTVYQGDQVSEHDFVEEAQSMVGLSYTIEEGNVGYSIAAPDIVGVDGYIRVGDTVDILVKYVELDKETGEEIIGSETYEYAFQGLKVVKIATYEDANTAENGNILKYDSVTLEVSKEIAKQLIEVEDKTKGGYKLVLNHRDMESEEDSGKASKKN